MGFIELTFLTVGRKTILNIDHLVRYGAQYKDATNVVGSYVVTTTPSGDKASYFITVKETPEQIEQLLASAQVKVLR